MVRRLIDEYREFPATMILGSLWVIVFAVMVLFQVVHGHLPTTGKLILGIRGSHLPNERRCQSFLSSVGCAGGFSRTVGWAAALAFPRKSSRLHSPGSAAG